MISKTRLKFIRSLHLKKFREEHGLFIAEGEKVVSELLKSDYRIDALYATEGYAVPAGAAATPVDPGDMKAMSLLESPAPVLAVVHRPDRRFKKDFTPKGMTLVLDRVADPGNMGTILRTADWFGVEHVLCLPGTVEAFGPKAVQASMGSVFRVKCFEVDGDEAVDALKLAGCPVYGAVTNGLRTTQLKFPDRVAFVLGNESAGVAPGLLAKCDYKVTIPRKKTSRTESLNVAIAAAVLCYKHFADQNPL